MQPKIPKRGVRCEIDLNIQNPSQHALQATEDNIMQSRIHAASTKPDYLCSYSSSEESLKGTFVSSLAAEESYTQNVNGQLRDKKQSAHI